MKTKEELLKIYSAYLPYQLQCLIQGHNNQDGKAIKETMLGIYDGTEIFTSLGLKDYQTNEIEDVFPILYSMDMLTKEIEHKGERFIPWDELTNGETVKFNYADFAEDWNKRDNYSFENYVQDWILGSKHCFDFLPYGFIQKLIEWHFNVFGLDESEYIKNSL